MNPPENKTQFEQKSEMPISPEVPQAPSQEQEIVPESEKREAPEQRASLDQAIEGLKTNLRRPRNQKKVTKIPVVRDDMTLQIETILSDGLEDAFLELTPIQQQEFKIKGEKTAHEVRQLLGATKVKVKKVFQLIVDWLKLLPGVNRYYLIQEAKIKTDQIISLKLHDT